MPFSLLSLWERRAGEVRASEGHAGEIFTDSEGKEGERQERQRFFVVAREDG